MLLELFILFQILALVCFAVGFVAEYPNSVLFFVMAAVLSGILSISAFGIVTNTEVVSSQEVYQNSSTLDTIYYTYTQQSDYYVSIPVAGLNMGLFAMAMIFGIFDMWTNRKGKSS